MFIVTVILTLTPLLGLFYLLRRYRKPAAASRKAGVRKLDLPAGVRNLIRNGIVKEANRLCDLEAEVTRYGEGTDPDILPDTADRARLEAARLRTNLEAQCVRHGMPLGLVRRRRSASLSPTIGLLPKITDPLDT